MDSTGRSAGRSRNGRPKDLHFMRSSRAEASFQTGPPEPASSWLPVCDVDIKMAKGVPQPAVSRLFLWRLRASSSSSSSSSLSSSSLSSPRAGLSINTDNLQDEDEEEECTCTASKAPLSAVAHSTGLARYDASLLKSALQKCVRRRRSETARAVAQALAETHENMAQLLRRLPVILVEDAVPIPQFSVLIWLMIAHSKGHILDREDIQLVMDLAHRAAALPVHDCILRPEELPTISVRPALLGADGNKAIVNALLLRACYGGMAGDVRMLVSSAALWQARLTGEDADAWSLALSEVAEAEEPPPKRDASEYESTFDLPLESVDFHCRPNMVAFMMRKLGGCFAEDVVREAIWYHSSSVNLKRPWTDPRAPLKLPPAPTDTPDRKDKAALARTAACWEAAQTYAKEFAQQALLEGLATNEAVASTDTRSRKRAKPADASSPAQSRIDSFFARKAKSPTTLA